MSEVVLFHSILGLRPSVREFAAELRGAGHTVHTPDLYEGTGPFASYADALAHQRAVGFKELLRRATIAVDGLPATLIYAGWSAGCAPAQILGARRSGARAVVLMHGGSPLSALRIERWPASVAVQMHCAERDPFSDVLHRDALAAELRSSGARCERFEYPLATHLFADSHLSEEFDESSAALMLERVMEFVR